MSLFVHIFQLFNGIMGIYLRCRQATMAKEFFYSVEVGTFVGKVGGKAMSQNVRAFLAERLHFGG